MTEIEDLLNAAETARDRLLARARGVSRRALVTRPSEGAWSVAEVLEHLVLAEDFGVFGLWRAVDKLEAGDMPEPLPPALANRSIEQVFVDLPDRVDAPPAVVPKRGGHPVDYWLARSNVNARMLEEVAHRMERTGLENVVLPHFVAGPLNGHQRLQFFRWHLERHAAQVERILAVTEVT